MSPCFAWLAMTSMHVCPHVVVHFLAPYTCSYDLEVLHICRAALPPVVKVPQAHENMVHFVLGSMLVGLVITLPIGGLTRIGLL